MLGLGCKLSKVVQLNHLLIDGGLGAKPLSLGDFLIFREKITISTPFESHFACLKDI